MFSLRFSSHHVSSCDTSFDTKSVAEGCWVDGGNRYFVYVLAKRKMYADEPLTLPIYLYPTLAATTIQMGKRTIFGSSAPKIALDEEFPGVPRNVPAVPSEAPVTNVSTLPNGVRVVSHDNHGLASTVGIFLNGGSRAETDAVRGASHLIRQLAFVQRSTTKTGLRIVRDVENAGGVCWSGSDRESVFFAASSLRPNAGACFEGVAEVAFHSAFRPWDVAEGRERVLQDLSGVSTHDQLEDALFSAAFYDSETLGKPSLAPTDNLGNLSGPALADFMGGMCDPSNIVVSGVAIHHGDLVKMAETHCGHLASSEASAKGSVAAEYVGGEARVRTSSPNVTVSLAFPTPGLGKESAAYEVLGEILGNGSVYTKGRGAGMGNTRLAKAVAESGFVLNANGFSNFFTDAGLVGITAQASGDQADAAVEFMAVAMKSVASGLTDQEVNAAKARLKLKHATASSKDKLQQLASSVFATGDAGSADAISAVTTADVAAAAKAAVSSRPSLASIGNTGAVPRYNRVQGLFA